MAEIGINGNGFDAYSPPEVAKRIEKVGVTKATMPPYRMATLAVLAGAFIALGGTFYLTVTSSLDGGYGWTQLMGGIVFSLGLILVVVAGAELFTGNNLLIMSLVSHRIGLGLLARNWLVVFLFNMIGAMSVAALTFLGEHWTGGGGVIGLKVLAVGAAKVTLPFHVIFIRAILANVLVCLAVWLTAAARTVTDKIVAIVFPISAFVAAGFEHSIANMFFIPYAIWLKQYGPADLVAQALTPEKAAALNWGGFIHNVIPATLGNIVGGAVLVGLVYWICYLWDGTTLPHRRRRDVA